MPRTTSPVDTGLAEHASRAGHPTTARQIERWRQGGLLPPNRRRSAGRGSVSTAPDGALDLVVWLAQHARRGRRPFDLALGGFGEGQPIPEATVRKAFLAAVRRVQLTIENDLPKDAAPGDIADAAVSAGLAATMLPSRVRKIDEALCTLSYEDLPPELRDLAREPQQEAIRPSDWTFNTVLAMRAGGGELTVEQLGGLARSVMPPSLAAPFAADMERQWPDNEADKALLLNDSGGLSFFPAGDMREVMAEMTNTLPLTELRKGWAAAEQLSKWSTELCDEVESEIHAGAIGPASMEWMSGAIVGLGRIFLTVGLRDAGAGPADLAFTTLLLLWQAQCIRLVRDLLPEGQFEYLRAPGVLPPSFLQLLVATNALTPSPPA